MTLIHVRANKVALEKAIRLTYFEFVFLALRYPACNSHAHYFHLWSVRFYGLFKHYLIKERIFEKKNNKFVCYISSTNSSETFLILRSIERHIKSVYRSHVRYPSCLSGLNDTRQDLRKILKV